MAELIDRHEFRLALEAEECIAKEMFRRGGRESHTPLITAFFEIIYRTLNKAKSVKHENLLDPQECPTNHTQFLWNEGSGSVTSKDGVARFESESHAVRQPWHTRFCPDCGAPLGGSQ